MPGRLFTIMSVVSLALWLSACALWWRSDRGGDRVSHVFGGHRYTARSRQGMLGLTGPPPLGPRDDPTSADALSAAVRNDRISWTVYKGWRSDRPRWAELVGAIEWAYTSELVADPRLSALDAPGGGLVPPVVALALLAAMDVPDRAIAGHVLLEMLHRPPPIDHHHDAGGAEGAWPAGEATLGDLRLSYAPSDDAPPIGAAAEPPFTVPARVWATPAAVAVARDAWHDRLDVTAASVPWWAVVLGTGTLPAWWATATLARARRNRRRRRAGLCLACGYDLSATPGRCPEWRVNTSGDLSEPGRACRSTPYELIAINAAPTARPDPRSSPQKNGRRTRR